MSEAHARCAARCSSSVKVRLFSYRGSLRGSIVNMDKWLPTDRPYWFSLAVLALAGSVLGHAENIRDAFNPDLVMLGAAFLVAGRACDWMRQDDNSLVLVMEGVAAFLTSIAVVAPLAYIATRSPFPAVDQQIAAMEAHLGFDARAVQATVFGHPWLHALLSAAYDSFKLQYLAVIVVAPRTRRPDLGMALMRQSLLVLCISYVLAWILPTLGTMPDLEPWASDWRTLHDTRLPFAGGSVQAIISLPSFHAAMAVMLVNAARGVRWIFWPAAALNALLVLATPVFGFHHLVDIVAGGGLALLSIRLLDPSRADIATRRTCPFKCDAESLCPDLENREGCTRHASAPS